jgi:hypothetical protein
MGQSLHIDIADRGVTLKKMIHLISSTGWGDVVN